MRSSARNSAMGRRPRESGDPASSLLILPLTSLTSRTTTAIGNPEGGRHGWRPFSDRGRMPSPKMTSVLRTFVSGFDLTRQVLSFGYFSLHQQRKVTRPSGRKLLTLMWSFRSRAKSRSKAFALTGELLSFAGPKESSQRKGPSPVTSKPLKQRGVPSSFSDSPSWLDPKTAAIHGRRPPGVQVLSWLAAYEKSKSKAEAKTKAAGASA